MMSTSQSRQAELEAKRRYWKQHLEDWKGEGIAQAEYCRKHDLKVHRFIYWKKKFQPSESNHSLIELKLPPAAFSESSSTSPLRVEVNRFHVAVGRGFDPLTLRQLVYALESI